MRKAIFNILLDVLLVIPVIILLIIILAPKASLSLSEKIKEAIYSWDLRDPPTIAYNDYKYVREKLLPNQFIFCLDGKDQHYFGICNINMEGYCKIITLWPISHSCSDFKLVKDKTEGGLGNQCSKECKSGNQVINCCFPVKFFSNKLLVDDPSLFKEIVKASYNSLGNSAKCDKSILEQISSNLFGGLVKVEESSSAGLTVYTIKIGEEELVKFKCSSLS